MNPLLGLAFIAQLLDFNSLLNHLDHLLTYKFQVCVVKFQVASFQPNSFACRIALFPKFLCAGWSLMLLQMSLLCLYLVVVLLRIVLR